MIIPPLVQSVTEKLPDGMQKFDHSQVHVLATMDMIPSVYPRCTTVYPRCTHSVPLHMLVLSLSTLGLIDSFPDFPTIQFLFTMYLQYNRNREGVEGGGGGVRGVFIV